jgi:hypothetical protein
MTNLVIVLILGCDMNDNELIQFEDKHTVRRVWVADEEGTGQWFFAVVDVIAALMETESASQYWYKLKKRTLDNTQVDLAEGCITISLRNPKNNRNYDTECAALNWLFRIIQAIPSPKAEPIKRWLGELGQEKIEQAGRQTLSLDALRDAYLDKGYPQKWVAARMQSIVTNSILRESWEEQGVDPADTKLLKSVISEGVFDIAPADHKKLKQLSDDDVLQDHMTRLELIFDMLGEESTIRYIADNKPVGYEANLEGAKASSRAARVAREAYEKDTQLKVLSDENFKHLERNLPKGNEQLGANTGE